MRPILLTTLVVLLLAVSAPGYAGEATTGGPAPAGASAMRAYIDPQTGEFTSEGPPLALPSSQSLPPQEEDTPGGGKMVRLHGQFLSAVVARIAPDGSERFDCVTTDDGPALHAAP